MKRLIIQQFLVAACGILPLYASSPAATVQISTELTPAGGWAQIKFTVTQPILIASGQIVLNLDPAVFGPIQSAGTFGANGDAYGLATINGESLTAQFYSPSAGIGQLNGLPILVVSVPVLASAAANPAAVTAAITLSDINKNVYSVTVLPGSIAVGGAPFSVQTVPSGMGVLPANSIVPITGTGFTASTTATMDGVAISSTKFVSATEIDLTLAAPTELTGKQLRVIDSGVEVDYFCFKINGPSPEPAGYPSGDNAEETAPVMFPLQTMTAGQLNMGSLGGGIAFENPQTTPATISFQFVRAESLGLVATGSFSATIPAGDWGLYGVPSENSVYVTSQTPFRALALPTCSLSNPTALCLSPLAPSGDLLTPPQPTATPASLAIQWQIGSAAPAPQVVYFNSTNPVTVTASGTETWLSAASSGILNGSVAVSVNTAQLAVGTYQGSVIVTPAYGTPLTIPVTLTVTNSAPPTVAASPTSVNLTLTANTTTPASQTIGISSTGSTPVSIGVSASWILATLSSNTTPAILTVTYDPTIIQDLYTPQTTISGNIMINGPGNSISIPVQLAATGVLPSPTSLIFSAQTGSAAQTQTVGINSAGTFSVSANQSWLSASILSTNGLSVTANPAGLAAGAYNGAVTITQSGNGSIQVPVSLTVFSTAPPLQASPTSLTFIQSAGLGAPPQYLSVQSGGTPLNFAATENVTWIFASHSNNAPTPSTVEVSVVSPVPPLLGEYQGDIFFAAASGAIAVPVTLLNTPSPVSQPILSSIVNGASLLPGGVSPGEILTIRGYGAGSSIPTNLQLTSNLQVETTEGGAQVLFDGKPAPILYTSAYQTNVVVPYEVQSTTTIQVTYNGLTTTAWGVPVVAAAPAIFTIGSTGVGQGAILNQDNSVNSAANPAARGSVIQVYATGEGQTTPAGVTGSVSGTSAKTPLLPVTATIGGVTALVQYAGSAPGEVAGLLQVNVLVPAGITPGPSVPISITVGTVQSPAGVTIGVQ